MAPRLSKSFSKGVFVLLTILLMGVLLEFGSWAILSFSSGELYSRPQYALQRQAAQAAGRPAVPNSGAEAQDAADSEHHVGPENRAASYRARNHQAIHPYLGFVSNTDTHPAAIPGYSSRQALEYGFPRNQEDLFHSPSPDRFVVAVFGGSVAVHVSALDAAYLRRALSQQDALADREVIVVSMALGGYKQPQQLMALNWFLALGAHFDAVINLDGFNEVALSTAELVPNAVSPHFPRGWQVMVADFDQNLRLELAQLSTARTRRASWAEFFDRSPWRYSLAAALIWNIADRRLAGEISVIDHRLMRYQSDGSFHVRGPSYDAEQAMQGIVDLWRRTSLQMHQLCQARNIPYFHFLQPNQYFAGTKPLSDEEKKRFWRRDHPYRAGVVEGYPLLVDAGQELLALNVSFLDLTHIFEDNRATLYADACCHLNPEGYGMMARVMASYIANKLQPRRASRFEDERSAP